MGRIKLDQSEITDDATELATLAGTLSSTKSVPHGFSYLAKMIGIGLDDPVFLELLGVVKERLIEVQRFAEGLGSEELPDHLAKDAISAAQNFITLLSPSHLASQWTQQKGQIVSELNMQSLRWFGHTMRKYRPLYKINAEQLGELQSRLQAQIEEISTGDYFEWEKPMLVSGLQRIQKTLKYLPFFGHDHAVKEIFAVTLEVQALHHSTADDAQSVSKRQGIFNTLGVLGFAMTLFAYPDTAATAINRYKTWMPEFVLSLPAAPQSQKLLPAPAAIRPEPPHVEHESEQRS
jgi:hypothetical protein